MNAYNTNLASEFFVLAALHRLGLTANLTLGNKKSVDIVVVCDRARAVTIDVKGLAGKTGWPVDKIGHGTSGHFIVFVGFKGKINDPRVAPDVYVVPSHDVDGLAYRSPKGRRVMQVGQLRATGTKYLDRWDRIVSA